MSEPESRETFVEAEGQVVPIVHCLGCACTEFTACFDQQADDACHWVAVSEFHPIGICSACQPDLEELETTVRLLFNTVRDSQN